MGNYFNFVVCLFEIFLHSTKHGLFNHIQLEFHEELPSNYVSGSKSNEIRKDEEGEIGFKASRLLRAWHMKVITILYTIMGK